jgi:hypothetical protein
MLLRFPKKHGSSQAWWLTPIIPDTQDANTGGSQVSGQLRQLSEALSQKKKKNKKNTRVSELFM